MTGTAEERWRLAVREHLNYLAVAQLAVDAKCPRTRYPWHRRLWWRVVGEPADVRRRKHLESRKRAELFAAELHARRRG